MKNIIDELKKRNEVLWINPNRIYTEPGFELHEKKFIHVKAASNRLLRFMPYIENIFPETAPRKGIIESDLLKLSFMEDYIKEKHENFRGKLLLKDDGHLPIAGSVKARGGIYEVLKFAEELAIKEGILKPGQDHLVMQERQFRELFGKYCIQVGSTGNLGLSIGIMAAALGFRVKVHMSVEAKEWKKALLRSKGVEVLEYPGDYSQAVAKGRQLSKADPFSYFVDDENSEDLFMGYATAAFRVKVQLYKMGITVNERNPLFVYIPCGVGGAPGGITFGLKQVFGNNVHCFFAEPTEAPCFTLGMSSDKADKISVYDIGLSGKTVADGLAVGRPSGLVCKMMKPLVSGSVTVSDKKMLEYKQLCMDKEKLYLEPSATAGFNVIEMLFGSAQGQKYLDENIKDVDRNSIIHLVWATGGGLAEKLDI